MVSTRSGAGRRISVEHVCAGEEGTGHGETPSSRQRRPGSARKPRVSKNLKAEIQEARKDDDAEVGTEQWGAFSASGPLQSDRYGCYEAGSTAMYADEKQGRTTQDSEGLQCVLENDSGNLAGATPSLHRRRRAASENRDGRIADGPSSVAPSSASERPNSGNRIEHDGEETGVAKIYSSQSQLQPVEFETKQNVESPVGQNRSPMPYHSTAAGTFVASDRKIQKETSEFEVAELRQSTGALQKLLQQAVKEPQLLNTPSLETRNSFRTLIGEIYNAPTEFKSSRVETGLNLSHRKRQRRNLVRMGPLVEIAVSSSLEADQVWEQLMLRNRPLLPYLSRALGHARRVVERSKESESDLGKVLMREGNEALEDASPPDNRADTSIHAEETFQRGAGLEDDADPSDTNFGEAEKSNAARREAEASAVVADELASPRKKKVRFSLDSTLTIAGEKGLGSFDELERSPSSLDDGFFNVADMEAFADEAEELATMGKLAGSDDDASTSGEDMNVEDTPKRSRVHAGGLNPVLSKNKIVERVRYDDFFDSPKQSGRTFKEGEKNAKSSVAHRRRFHDNEGGDEDHSESDESIGDAEPLTPLEVERSKLRDTMAAIEESNVGKKPWQLRGEVNAHARPLNSILESDFEHDIAMRPKVASSLESAASIEDVIRQRIFDGLFDDVVRKLPLEYEEAKRKRERNVAPDVSQEKPTEGLAEMYEREYAEERRSMSVAAEAVSGTVQRDEGSADNPEQAEVNRLYKRLSTKLDALASLHFMPPPPKALAEMEVKPNVPAFAAEEAIPEAVSDAALLAAREVHAAKASRAQGDAELDKQEKSKRRRTKKRRVSAQNKEKAADQKLEERSDPALAEQRRAERTLQRPGKLLKPVMNPNDKRRKGNKSGKKGARRDDQFAANGGYSRSTKFFAELQSTVEKDIAGKKKRDSHAAGRDDGSHSAARLKL